MENLVGLLAISAISGTMRDVWVVGVIFGAVSLFRMVAAKKLKCSLNAEQPKARMLVVHAHHVANHQGALGVVAVTRA
jgi:hypothetical protein